MGEVLLEVAVRHPRDVAGAAAGGADRLHLSAAIDPPSGTGPGSGSGSGSRSGPGSGEGLEPDAVGLSPEPALVSSVCRESDLPVFVVLRSTPSWTTDADGVARLADLAEDYLACGAAGVDVGFLDQDLEVDAASCTLLAEALPGVPWTFHRAVDATLDPRRSWRRLVDLPGLVAVRSAGSPRGLAEGYDDLLAMATEDPEVARLLMPGGGLRAEQVPWLVRAGVRQLHLAEQVRPGATYRSDVDAGHVRSWRLLVDSLRQRA